MRLGPGGKPPLCADGDHGGALRKLDGSVPPAAERRRPPPWNRRGVRRRRRGGPGLPSSAFSSRGTREAKPGPADFSLRHPPGCPPTSTPPPLLSFFGS